MHDHAHSKKTCNLEINFYDSPQKLLIKPGIICHIRIVFIPGYSCFNNDKGFEKTAHGYSFKLFQFSRV